MTFLNIIIASSFLYQININLKIRENVILKNIAFLQTYFSKFATFMLVVKDNVRILEHGMITSAIKSRHLFVVLFH